MKKIFKINTLIIAVVLMIFCLVSCDSLKDQWYSSYPGPTYEYEQQIAAKSLENLYINNLNSPEYFKVTADCTVYVFTIDDAGEEYHSIVKIPCEYKNENNEIISDVIYCYDKYPGFTENMLSDETTLKDIKSMANIMLDYINDENNLISKKTYTESQINYLIV